MDWPEEPAGFEAESGLPHLAEEFRLELLRRLALLDREIRALDSEKTHRAFLESAETLRRMRTALQDRLATAVDDKSWTRSRLEIIGLWRQYRREFERLAALWQHRYTARSGQRDRGPRW